MKRHDRRQRRRCLRIAVLAARNAGRKARDFSATGYTLGGMLYELGRSDVIEYLRKCSPALLEMSV